MKLNKMIYDIRESVSQYQDDTTISDEYISYLISVYRAEVLKNELNNFQRTTNHINVQSFCVELEEVSAYDCGIEIDCNTIIRSKQSLPAPIKTHVGYALTAVRPTDRYAKPFSVISEDRLPYFNHSKFFNSIYYFLGSDSHLYIVGKNEAHRLIRCLNVSGVFSDPLDLDNYKQCCDCADTEVNKCFDVLESEYPITDDQVRLVVDAVVQKLAGKLKMSEDTNNNSNDQ